ncbi:MAG TPA: DEAD/DEAH box helicase [Bacteroidia bacterium]|jgi:superfamily II DNA/RNA helicase|nr:DEAD/DEAH box helicase [Bacteroidia bacterium]
MATFEEFGLDNAVMDGVDAMGYTAATPIQEQTIPLILQGRDLIACAQTGTGKTAAFLLPTMHRILHSSDRGSIHTMIISPTRELALQIDNALTGFAYFTGISSIAVYGGGTGESFDREKKALSTGTDMIVATPGRLMSHLNLGYVKLDKLKTLILDEADRMLDMGFYDDIIRIVRMLPKDRQTLLFSATMPTRIRQLASQLLVNPAEVNIAMSKPAEKIKQLAYCVYDTQKIPLLTHILKQKEYPSVIIFSSTKQNVKNMEKEMKRMGFNVAAVHSDLEQNEREEVLRQFRNRNIRIIVATDVLSRGIDIENISMVLNYDVPGDGEDYVHRVGRTARAESEGEAITFVSPLDMRKFAGIEKLIGYEVEKGKVPDELGEVPAYSGNSFVKKKGNFNRRKNFKKNFNKK